MTPSDRNASSQGEGSETRSDTARQVGSHDSPGQQLLGHGSQVGSPLSVSVASSLALMGDALLYAVLPAQAAHLGIPLTLVGVLLSANRFIRLITNSWAASIYQRHGRAWPFFIAMVVASLTTLAYGLPYGLWVFLPARILWGTCWSFLNVGMYLSVIDHVGEAERGRWMGRVKSVSRIGTIVAVTLGGYLTDRLGFRPVMYILAVLAALGALVSFRDAVRVRKGGQSSAKVTRTVKGSGSSKEPAAEAVGVSSSPGARAHVPQPLLYAMGFVTGLVMHGVVVGTLALLVVQRYGDSVDMFGLVIGAATLSGLLLGIRWVFEIAFAPVSGYFGDRFGSHRVVPLAAFLLAILLAFLAFVHHPAWLLLLSCLIFAVGVTVSICLDAVAGNEAVASRRINVVMSRYVTAQDLGAAIGPLVGFLIGLGVGLGGLYLGASLITLGTAAAFALRSTRFAASPVTEKGMEG